MSEQSFSLVPFPSPMIPEVNITGKISLRENFLALHYSLAGKIEDVFLPLPSSHPGRKDELWKTTCFEFFLAIKDQPGYWEFNMSPSGDWNIYHMDAYRRAGFREETSIQQLPFEIQGARVATEESGQNNAGVFTLTIAVDLSVLIQVQQPLEIGITAILHTKDGNETYWALTHSAPHADFHLRESFTLALAGQNQLSQQSVPGD